MSVALPPPGTIAACPAPEFEAALDRFAHTFATAPATKGSSALRKRGETIAVQDDFADWLVERDLVIGDKDGALFTACPWETGHSSPTGPDAAAYFPAGTNGYSQGAWHCLHASCSGRGLAEYEMEVGYIASHFDALVETDDTAPARPAISATPYEPRDPKTIPARAWLYGRQLLRGSLSLLIAPGATGKTALLAGTALALATGRDLLGYHVHGGPTRVWLWNLEDSLDEMARLIEAARLRYQIAAGGLKGCLFVDSGPSGSPLCLASQRPGKAAEINEQAFAEIAAEINARSIDVLIIDPLISAHLVAENDNGAIDLVAKRLARLAVETGAAVLVAHHTSKLGGGEVTAEKARGASALVNAARSAVALNRMTEPEAQKLGVPSGERARHFRLYDDKNNRAPPAAVSDWFRLASVDLGTPLCRRPCGLGCSNSGASHGSI